MDRRAVWHAICANKDCGWSHIADSKLAAMILADGHQFEQCRDRTHRVHLVDIPAQSQPASNTSRNANQTR